MIKHFGPRVICKSHGPVELYSGCNTVVSHEIESENSMSVAPRAIKGLHVTVATFLWSGPLPPCSQIEKSVDLLSVQLVFPPLYFKYHAGILRYAND